MFLAGLEIDLGDFKKNSKKSLIFGLLTFIIPMTLGTLSGVYILKFSVPTSVLLASMFASHTLIAYPLISKMGVAKNKAVNITVGGTLITDTLALLVLAVIVGMTTGEVNAQFWLRLSLSILVFGMIVMLLFPIIGRWFFKRFDDNVSQYIFVLVMVYLGAVLAEMAGIEAIIGAFLAGLALNRLIPHTSPLMNRVEFVGNAIFIPFFLIGVGMLIDYRAFFKDLNTIWVASVMIAVATSAKFIAAWITQKSFKFSTDERRLIFGLSNAQAAATLAAVLVGYNIILNQSEIDQALLLGEVVEPKRLLNDTIMNGTILMILFTCTIASFVAQKGAKNIALLENSNETEKEHESLEKILIPISNIDITDELVNLGVTVKSKKNKNGLFALNIVDNNTKDSASDKNAKKILDRAAVTASATDNHIHELLRYDLNIVNGISSVIKEHKITDLILGLHSQKGISNSFLGNLTEGILTKCNTTTLIYKPAQPFATIKRHLIIVPENAEKEIGFPFWLIKLWNIARNSGAKLEFYASSETIQVIQEIQSKHPIQCEFEEFSDWEDFLILSRNVQDDDNLIIILSRKDKPSFQPQMTKMPQYLNKYFVDTSYILIYPMQIGVSDTTKIDLKNPTFIEPFEKLDEIGKTIAKIFKRMK
jgi:Kef-type K+ transport system membrane component KefB/nucleotide-binding universal stress UspA family protein